MRNGGFAAGAWVAGAIVAFAFYAVFAHVRTVKERAGDREPLPTWTRYALPLSILAFLVVAVAVAWLAPAWFGGVILGGCIGVTIAFQVRRPRRPMPPSRPAEPPPGPPDD